MVAMRFKLKPNTTNPSAAFYASHAQTEAYSILKRLEKQPFPPGNTLTHVETTCGSLDKQLGWYGVMIRFKS